MPAIAGDLETINFKICRSAPSAIRPLHNIKHSTPLDEHKHILLIIDVY